MRDSSQSSTCVLGCSAPVPPELVADRLCVLHFTQRVERTCAEMHRQIALGGPTPDRQTEAAIYINKSAYLLAGFTSSLCLSDGLKGRILSTFLSLMNLRENLERAGKRESYSRIRDSSTASRASAAT